MDCMIPKAVAEQAFFCTYLLISIRYNLVKLARDENLAQLMFKGIPDPSVLQGVEFYRFTLQIQAVVLNYSNIYMLHQSGALDAESFESLDSQMRNFCNSPGISSYWARSGSNFPRAFRQYMDNDVLKEKTPGGRWPGQILLADTIKYRYQISEKGLGVFTHGKVTHTFHVLPGRTLNGGMRCLTQL